MQVKFTDYGHLTTPQLHYLVANHKLNLTPDDYITNFANAFNEFRALTEKPKGVSNMYERKLTVDCANGVGAITFAKFKPLISEHIDLKLINTKHDICKLVNEKCGAEFVHKDNSYPEDFNPKDGMKSCSFDGDADRLIYFTNGKEKNNPKPEVIDGDKQFALIISYIRDLLKEIGVDVPHVLVNTAYANSRANVYL